MSGGRFNYAGVTLDWIAQDIEEIIYNNNNAELDEGGDRKGHWLSDATIEEFKKGVRILKLAAIYEHRIDWLLSGDDSEESFARRLKNALEALEKEYKND